MLQGRTSTSLPTISQTRITQHFKSNPRSHQYLSLTSIPLKEENHIRFISQNMNGFSLERNEVNSLNDIETLTKLGADILLFQETN